MTYSHMGPPTLPSAQLHFTSEFGMGSGGSTTLWLSGKTFYLIISLSLRLFFDALLMYAYTLRCYLHHSLALPSILDVKLSSQFWKTNNLNICICQT